MSIHGLLILRFQNATSLAHLSKSILSPMLNTSLYRSDLLLFSELMKLGFILY